MGDLKTEVNFKDFLSDENFLKRLVKSGDQEIIARTRFNIFSFPIILCIFLFVTPFFHDFPDIAWYSIIGVAFILISRFSIIFLYDKVYEKHQKTWRFLFYSNVGLTAILSGIFVATILHLYGLNWMSLFVLFLVSGITSGATSAFSAVRYVSLIYILLLLLPTIFLGFIQARPETIAVSISIFFYLVMMGITSRFLYKRRMNGFAKDYALKIQAKKLEAARDELEQRVQERTAELANANKVLIESEQRYNALFSGINDAVLVHYLPKADVSENFIEANEIACRMLEYSKNQLCEMNMESINAFQTPTNIAQVIQELETKNSFLFEQLWIKSDGQHIPVEVHARRFEFKDRKAIIYTARDITERKKTQEMMIQTEKIMSVGGLAAGMAHEINNPLAGVLQTSQVLKNRLKETIPANVKAADELNIQFDDIKAFMETRKIYPMIDSIVDAARRATQTIRNMLSFARKSSSEFYLEDIPDLMNKTLDIAKNDYNLKKKFDFRNIRIQQEYEENLAKVSCKSSEIQQVFFNILSNGAQAMATVDRLADPTFIIRISRQADVMKIEIQDNGPGINENIKKRVFEPFFTTKPPGKGTGLGLSVSHMIVKNNHHGSMEIKSEPGQGTNFIICLPFENAGIVE